MINNNTIRFIKNAMRERNLGRDFLIHAYRNNFVGEDNSSALIFADRFLGVLSSVTSTASATIPWSLTLPQYVEFIKKLERYLLANEYLEIFSQDQGVETQTTRASARTRSVETGFIKPVLETEPSCSMCFKDFSAENGDILVLPNQKIFHKNCLNNSIEINPECIIYAHDFSDRNGHMLVLACRHIFHKNCLNRALVLKREVRDLKNLKKNLELKKIYIVKLHT